MMDPNQVHASLSKAQLVDGYPLVVDLDKSEGVWLHDARTGKRYLDAFTCFASWPVGFNHPMLKTPEFEAKLLRAARTKIANSDLYTPEMAEFVEAFSTRVTPDGFDHHFWVSGGALAVENSLKIAFDWKARKLGRTEFAEDTNDLVILHFEAAFHGRSGYTMSLTNTVPDKIGLFPKFPWPRVYNPGQVFDLEGNVVNDIEAEEKRACDEIDAAFAKHGNKVAGILLEPLQGEGGDVHFRTEFLQKLRDYADQHEALLIFDEVQTGFFGSGKPWLWQHHDVRPDIVCFGKKTQVCGVYAGPRIDTVEDNVFARSSRINSTWGGNLVDMVRCHRFIDIIEEENLASSITERGARLLNGLRELAREHGVIQSPRGVGSLVAFTLESPAAQAQLLKSLFDKEVMALPCGPNSVRFRLPLVITDAEVDEILNRLASCMPLSV